MKKITCWMFLLILLCTSFSFRENHSYRYTPVLMDKEELSHSVKYHSGEREMENPGKIYYKAPYIYVNEQYKGVHVINNSDPAHPVKEGFIIAPGCIDMAVKEDILYLDNATDLVAFDLNTKQVTKRIKEVFPEPLPPNNIYYPCHDRPENTVIVGWKKS